MSANSGLFHRVQAWQAPSCAYDQYVPAPVPTALPDGRPLFRDEEPWPGI
ncbi:hypothetical protein EDD92_4316 [Streptomyces sp. TLI_185]|nr:hypothetical protein EDD92_4316 [Streptomyces sp. TLI_185]